MVTSIVSPRESFFLEPIRAMATFRPKCKKCDNFGLYRLLRSGFFWFNFWFLYKSRYLLKFACFLFFEKSYIKGKIVPFTKAKNESSMFTTLHARGKVWKIEALRDGVKGKNITQKPKRLDEKVRNLQEIVNLCIYCRDFFDKLPLHWLMIQYSVSTYSLITFMMQQDFLLIINPFAHKYSAYGCLQFCKSAIAHWIYTLFYILM